MNAEAIRQQLTGAGPFVIRTTDGREFAPTHADYVGCTPHYVMIEDEQGSVEILEAESVAAIASGAPPKSFRNHAAFLKGYAPEDEGLYDDVPRG